MELSNFRNVEAEQNILGSILQSNNSILDIVDVIEAKDFYEPKHMIIYNTILELYKQNKGIDVITVFNILGAQAKDVGGLTYLSELYGTGIPRHIKEHAGIVKEKSKLRSLNIILQKTLKSLSNGKLNSRDIISQIQNETLSMSEINKNKAITDAELMNKTYDMIQRNYESGDKILGLETGISLLDKAINGLQKKKLYVIAGRPGMAKSAFALNIAQKVSETKRVLYYSLEMSEEELGLRRLAMTSFIDSAKIERGSMTDEEWLKITKTTNNISKCNCITDCTPGVHILTMKAQCKKMQLQGGIDALVIDYLGLMSKKNMGDSLREQLSNICEQLKNLAKDFNIPVILLSQLSRAPEGRPDHRPMLSDLKETGGVEENADVVILLYRDEYYNKDTEEKNVIEANIAKQRGGRTGTIKLAWMPQYQKIANLDCVYEGTYRKDTFKTNKE